MTTYLDDPTRYLGTVVQVTAPLVRDGRVGRRDARAQEELADLLADLETQVVQREPQALTAAERLRLLYRIESARAELLNSLNAHERAARREAAIAADRKLDEEWQATQ